MNRDIFRKILKDRLCSISPFSIILIYLGRIHRGFTLYCRLLRQYGAYCEFLFNPQIGIGDSYLAGLCISSFRSRYPNRQIILLQYHGSGSTIASNFSPDRVVDLSWKDLRALQRVYAFWGHTLPHLHVLHYTCSTHLEVLEQVEGLYGLTFHELFFLKVLGCIPPIRPHRTQPILSEEFNALFERHDLQRGKTVLLSPHSNTISTASMPAWIQLAQELQRQGFSVCTNLGKGENTIPGTLGLSLPITQVIPFLNAAGYFIGIRSGLCELICEATCPKIILYPNYQMKTGSSIREFYTMEQLECTRCLTELVIPINEKVEIKMNGDSDGNS